MKMSTNSNDGNMNYFAYITAPQHVTNELIQLNGTEFNSKCLIVQEAKNKPTTAFSEVRVPTTISPIFYNHLKNKNYQSICYLGENLCYGPKCLPKIRLF